MTIRGPRNWRRLSRLILGSTIGLFATPGLVLAQSSPPAIYSAAMAEAQKATDYTFAYTLTAQTSDGPVAARFDPRLGESNTSSQGWTLLSPDLNALTTTQKAAWVKIQSQHSPATAIQLSSVSGDYGYRGQDSQDGTHIVFSAKPLGSNSFSKSRQTVIDHLISHITIQTSPPRIVSVISSAEAPFTIEAIAKVDAVNEVVTLQYLPKAGVVVLRSVNLTVSGNSIVEARTPNEAFEISDVVTIPVPNGRE